MIHLPKLGIFVLLLSILSWSAVAQTTEGNKFIDGIFRINFLSGNGANTAMIGFSPSVGYFFKDNQALGSGLLLLFAEAGEGRSTSVGITPFARRYLPIVEDKFFFIAQLQLSLV